MVHPRLLALPYHLDAHAGTKPELQTRVLACFGLSAPASASHKLVFSYKMHDFILVAWAEELAQHSSAAIRSACTSSLSALGPWHDLPAQPAGYGRQGSRVSTAGKALLASAFGTRAAMQQALLAQRMVASRQAY